MATALMGTDICTEQSVVLKDITHGGSLSIFNLESFHYALSREITLCALEFHGTSVCTGRPFDE